MCLPRYLNETEMQLNLMVMKQWTMAQLIDEREYVDEKDDLVAQYYELDYLYLQYLIVL